MLNLNVNLQKSLEVFSMDNLRICRIAGIEAPIGTPVTFQGNEIGHVIRSMEEGFCECAINSDIVHSWIRGNKASFSLEVIRNG